MGTHSAMADDVVVGIVAYNTDLPVVEATLRSLRESDIPLSVQVLCNAPSKEYQQAVGALCARYDVEALLHMPNKGFGAGHNSIANASSAEWYICCNPDIEVRPDTIRVLIEAASALPNAVILGPKLVSENGEVQPLARKHITLWTWTLRQLWRLAPSLFKPYEITFDYNKTQAIQFTSGAFFAIKMDHFRQLKGFDEGFFLHFEDADLARRAEAFGTNYFVATAVAKHQWGKHWARSSHAMKQNFKSFGRYLMKHGIMNH